MTKHSKVNTILDGKSINKTIVLNSTLNPIKRTSIKKGLWI
jgi:hypothetical protein